MHATQQAQKASTAPKAAEAESKTALKAADVTRAPMWTQGWDNRPLTNLFPVTKGIQAKLDISQPGDPYEQEADRVAEIVDTSSEHRVHTNPSFSAAALGLQRSADSSGSSGASSGGSSGSSGGGQGGSIPKPTPKEDGTCDCRLDLCWRPIQAYWGIIGALGYKHGFINLIDSKCQTHNLYVDPSMHKAGSESHSHAVDSAPGWDTSGTACFTLNTSASGITCTQIDKLPSSTSKYEAMDVAYAASAGPNSNSFLEWILNDVGISISGLPSGLKAWDYYVKNPSMRSSPPKVKRGAPAPTTPTGTPAPGGANP